MKDLPKKVREYIESVGLESLDWKGNGHECVSDFALAIEENAYSPGKRLYLRILKPSGWDGGGDDYNSWMDTDDIGWVGPVRCVVAWTPVNLSDLAGKALE